jgi:hypothetical protein
MRNLLLIAGFLLAAPAFAGIYKSVDEHGNVIFTDQPTPGAEMIEKKEIPVIETRPVVLPESAAPPVGEDEEGYQRIEITSPANDSAVRQNDGNVSVSVALEPPLIIEGGHELVLYLDGSEYGRSSSPAFQMINLDRGAHNLVVAVVDGDGNELLRSKPVNFTLHRHSALHPPAKNVPPPPNK